MIAGYFIFPLAFAPALLFAGPSELGCDDCPTNLLLIERDPDLAAILTGVGALLYFSLFVVVLRRALQRWRGTGEFERLQLTPVYVCSLGDVPARDGRAARAPARSPGGLRSSRPA